MSNYVSYKTTVDGDKEAHVSLFQDSDESGFGWTITISEDGRGLVGCGCLTHPERTIHKAIEAVEEWLSEYEDFLDEYRKSKQSLLDLQATLTTQLLYVEAQLASLDKQT